MYIILGQSVLNQPNPCFIRIKVVPHLIATRADLLILSIPEHGLFVVLMDLPCCQLGLICESYRKVSRVKAMLILPLSDSSWSPRSATTCFRDFSFFSVIIYIALQSVFPALWPCTENYIE